MKKVIIPVLLALLSWSYSAFAQVTMIQSFDNIAADSNFVWTANVEGGKSYLSWTQDPTDKVEGTASLDVKTAIDSLHPWGSFSQIIYRTHNGQFMDWSSSDTLKLWIKIVKAPVYPQYMSFRIQILDQGPTGTDQPETYIYQNDLVLDAVSGWYELHVPLHEINSQGRTITPGDSGFVEAPGSWGGFTYNDDKLNIDKLIGWNIVCVTTTTSLNPNPPPGYANVPADSLEFKVDGFVRSGNKSVPFIIFNGIAVPGQLTPWTWGGAAISTEQGAGPVPNSNALKWVMGDDYGNGWNGFGFNVAPPFNLSGGWPMDSLKFLMKTNATGDSLRAQFENGVGKVGIVFNTANDTLWHQYSLALRNMVPQDGTTGFDPANVSVFGIMSQHDSALGIKGKVAFLTNMWTGNPKIDVIPPPPPTGVLVNTNIDKTNTIVWNDVPNIQNETYNVYYSFKQITDITASGVEIAATGILHGTNMAIHQLLAPGSNQNVSYYYAVVCRSEAGILGTPGSTGTATTNMAKGVTTIHWGAPANFAADADLSEWAGITPFRMYPSDHSGTVVTNTYIPNDTVCSVDAYVAMDANYLYVAFHVNTNNVYYDPNLDKLGNSYLNTCPDLFIGLYNWHGANHTGLQSGAQPDYHLRFSQQHIRIDNMGVDSLEIYGSDYAWNPTRFPDPLAGYNVEARIPWSDLAHKSDNGGTRNDNLFVPQEGMRIPIDFEINNVSPGKTQRDGQLDYSSAANGNSWSNVGLWTYTWNGNKWEVTGVTDRNQTVNSYKLEQNYPNPFNPSTSIRYSIIQPGKVVLKVYDILGREITTLVNQFQVAGNYTVNFDASKLASGVYFYRIESGAFQNVKKMMLLK
jgi:hypothetical protein